VDISFYDWRYYDDSKLQMYHLHHQVNIHSFPNQPINVLQHSTPSYEESYLT
jgi:hypothetical protein